MTQWVISEVLYIIGISLRPHQSWGRAGMSYCSKLMFLLPLSGPRGNFLPNPILPSAQTREGNPCGVNVLGTAVFPTHFISVSGNGSVSWPSHGPQNHVPVLSVLLQRPELSTYWCIMPFSSLLPLDVAIFSPTEGKEEDGLCIRGSFSGILLFSHLVSASSIWLLSGGVRSLRTMLSCLPFFL